MFCPHCPNPDPHTHYIPDVERIDLTIMDGELFDAHEHRDREGDGPFTNCRRGPVHRLSELEAMFVQGRPEGRGGQRSYQIDAENYVIQVSISKRLKSAPRPPAAHSHTGHKR